MISVLWDFRDVSFQGYSHTKCLSVIDINKIVIKGGKDVISHILYVTYFLSLHTIIPI